MGVFAQERQFAGPLFPESGQPGFLMSRYAGRIIDPSRDVESEKVGIKVGGMPRKESFRLDRNMAE